MILMILLTVIVGTIIQILLLGKWHNVRPWSRVILRTIFVQVLAVLAGVALSMNWPFSFPGVYGVLPLPFVFAEVFIALWYLFQRRSGPASYGAEAGDDD